MRALFTCSSCWLPGGLALLALAACDAPGQAAGPDAGPSEIYLDAAPHVHAPETPVPDGGVPSTRSWRGAVAVESGTSQVAAPSVAVDSHGNAFAVWQQLDGEHWQIWSSRYLAGGAWSAAELLDPDEAGNAGAPVVAVDAGGRAVVVFERALGDASSIWAARWDGDWGAAAVVDPAESGGYGPKLALDDSGTAIAVWKSLHADGGFGVAGARWTAREGWVASDLVDDDTGSNGELALAVASGGEAFVIWSQAGSIRERHFLPSGGWGRIIIIQPGDDAPAGDPDVAMDGAGNAIAVWVERTAGRPHVWASRYQVGDVWMGPNLIQDGDDWGTRPRVGMAMDGDAVAVWLEGVPGAQRVWANRFTGARGQWAASQPVAAAEQGMSPAVGLDRAGDAVAVWTEASNVSGTSLTDVVSNRSVAGDEWHTDRRLNRLDSWGTEARIAVAPGGDAVAIWTSGIELYANHLR